MTMTSHDATLAYEDTLPSGKTTLHLDLRPAVGQPFGDRHNALVAEFSMRETDEVPGLTSLRGSGSLAQFLEFFGHTWEDALARWNGLSFKHEYRLEHGPDNYIQIADWQTFYELLSKGVAPLTVEVAFIEHY